MIAVFKGSFTIDGVTFTSGEHVLNKEQSGHWYVQALISDGLVTVLQDDIEAEVVEEVVTEEEAPQVEAVEEVVTEEEAPQVEAVEEVVTEIKTRKKRG